MKEGLVDGDENWTLLLETFQPSLPLNKTTVSFLISWTKRWNGLQGRNVSGQVHY